MMTHAEIEQVFSVAFAAAKANAYVQQWQKEFPELWSDEQLARNVPLRVEFEQVYVFGTLAEAVTNVLYARLSMGHEHGSLTLLHSIYMVGSR